MSVVIYKKEGKVTRIAADGQFSLEGNGLIGPQQKLYKFPNGIIAGHCGGITQMQWLNNCLEKLDKNSCYDTLYNAITCSGIQPNGPEHRSLIFLKDKIYYLKISRDKIDIFSDISERKMFGIGFYEMPLGCMIMGASPEEAIKRASEYNMYFNSNVTCFEIKNK